MTQARLVQGPADKGHIVAGPAAAAGLGHDESQLIGVVPAGENGLHQLPHRQDGGIAGVVIDVLQAHIHRLAGGIVQDLHMVAVTAEHRLDHIKMNRGHLRRQNGIALVNSVR